MSNQSGEHSVATRRRIGGNGIAGAVVRMAARVALILAVTLPAPAVYGQAPGVATRRQYPLLISAGKADTPSSIAGRYLHDPSKGWMISEYNGKVAFSEGEPVLVPRGPFRLGGLTPDGYQTVPVLAYAKIGESPGLKRQVSRSAFDEQMRWLKREGFTAITPSQLVAFMNFSGQLPDRSVLITWDTQSSAFYKLAVPILKSLGFTATVFIAADGVGKKGAMTWDQLDRLRRDGFIIGCRGRRGRALTHWKKGKSFEAYFKSIQSRVESAKKKIEARLKAPCSVLAYPHGGTNGLIAAMAAKLGFSAAFTLSPGNNPFFADRFAIHRIPIDGRTNLAGFGKTLTTTISADLH
jgi:peptidoglycan/xylan/chitin deacetylase (PgdA/CDA1 family)